MTNRELIKKAHALAQSKWDEAGGVATEECEILWQLSDALRDALVIHKEVSRTFAHIKNMINNYRGSK